MEVQNHRSKSFGTLLLRYTHVALNAILASVGISSIVYGGLIISIIQSNTEASFAEQIEFPIYLIALGCVYMLISFMGFWITARDSFCFTMSYVVFMLVLIILLIVSMSYIEHLEAAMRDVIIRTWTTPKTSKNGLQHLSGSEDYEISRLSPNFFYGAYDNIFAGCLRKFVLWISGIAPIIKYSGMSLILVDLIVIVISTSVANNVK